MADDKFALRMLSRLRFKEKTSSLFMRLLVSFFIIIVLLVSFILYSVVFYRGSIKVEIIKYNTLSLQKTSENYENLIGAIHNAVLSFSLDLQGTQAQTVDYVSAGTTMQKVQLLLSNRLLYLDNLILMYKNSGLSLEKNRGTDADSMFGRYYNSKDYSASFWNEQFALPYKFQVLPTSTFAEIDSTGRAGERALLPIVIKNDQLPNFYLIALVQADTIYSELHQTISDHFYILNEHDQPLYTSSKSEQHTIPKFKDSSGYVLQDNVYYFYRTGASGLTYIHVVPDTSISSQVRWNFSFVLLLILTIAISVIASLLLSVRLHTPVKRIIDGIQKWNTPMPWESGIKEFNIIHDKISDILKTSRDIHQDMSEKESLLRYYAYSNVLKKIRHQHGDHTPWIPSNRPFVLLLFKVNYKSMLYKMQVDEERATSFIREYINRIIIETYSDSLTFQMENDQILSIIFTEITDPNIRYILKQINHMLEAEREYCFLTVTGSGGTEDWNEAYESGLEQLKQRRFNDETQIIMETEHQNEEIRLSQAQEEELDANLYNGNDDVVLQLVSRVLGRMRKSNESSQNVLLFAESIVFHIQKTLQQRNIDYTFLRQTLTELPNCHTYEQLEAVLSPLIKRSALLVREIKAKRDHIIEFVYEYLENNYDKDITLDGLAEKLSISRSYLSTYFKEKTGNNFVDYVNSVRIDKAKKLLLTPDIRIQDAAQLVGYQNINSFNRMFKKSTGFTPSEYRKK
ncbi:helix-turn-helix domain-containing protein [Paenibacillus sp. LMG 31461]|uniref:Helix-turn-helix domain-containing protein n=1 Tax=Paenibacillus plantarum TaxID=2654975 RepID=A0ABX1XFD7_9BACL|nr:AraC family transcriptional regulator [Paenibacillus plantarum]NOU66620.1 helix-turn-helix domain-containing protein [Paenibacillus plantarum]